MCGIVVQICRPETNNTEAIHTMSRTLLLLPQFCAVTASDLEVTRWEPKQLRCPICNLTFPISGSFDSYLSSLPSRQYDLPVNARNLL
jgi:hypothetical protein